MTIGILIYTVCVCERERGRGRKKKGKVIYSVHPFTHSFIRSPYNRRSTSIVHSRKDRVELSVCAYEMPSSR